MSGCINKKKRSRDERDKKRDGKINFLGMYATTLILTTVDICAHAKEISHTFCCTSKQCLRTFVGSNNLVNAQAIEEYMTPFFNMNPVDHRNAVRDLMQAGVEGIKLNGDLDISYAVNPTTTTKKVPLFDYTYIPS